METSHQEKELFLRISTYLTGFDEAELQGTGMLETYYDAVDKKNTPNDVRYFYERVADIFEAHGGNDPAIESAIAATLMPASSYSALAQNIIIMWYTGNWSGTPVSGQAYVQGLVWGVAEAHPPGAKQPGYGTWSMPPL